MVVGKDKKKQFDILKKLMNAPDVTEVVNACDAGRAVSYTHLDGTDGRWKTQRGAACCVQLFDKM